MLMNDQEVVDVDVEDEDGSVVVNADVESEVVVNNSDHEDDDLHDVEWILNLDVAQEVVLLDVEVDVKKDLDGYDEVVVVEGVQDDENDVSNI